MIKVLDLKAMLPTYKNKVMKVIEYVIDEQNFILGSHVDVFENNLSKHIGVEKTVGVSSGTDALLVALMALGVRQDAEVIVPAYSFFATAGAVARLGAEPVFVDVDIDTFTMSRDDCYNAINSNTKAIIPVHLFGQICDLGDLYRNDKIPAIIEDSAQALGASLNGVPTGQLGRIAATSFFPSKNLGGFGDGGAVYGMDTKLLEMCAILRTHGSQIKYHHDYLGGNFRLDAIQAAILNVKLEMFEYWTEKRIQVASNYNSLLLDRDLIQNNLIIPQRKLENAVHTYNQFTVRAHKRDELKDFLKTKGIETVIYYPTTLHDQPCFKDLRHKKGQFPNAERLSRESLSLPISPTLDIKDQEYIVDQIKCFYKM